MINFNLYKVVGKRIREAREEVGLKQEDLAAAISLTRTSVANIEAGRQRILLHTLFDIADALAVQPHNLLPKSSTLASMQRIDTTPPNDVSAGEWDWIQAMAKASEGE